MASAERPRRRYRTGPVTQALRWLGIAAAVAGAVVAVVVYPSLPETIPVQVDAAGQPEASGPRWTVLVLAGVWLLLQLGVTALSRVPHVLAYPLPVTEDNAQHLYREGERLLVWTGAALAVVFAGILAAVLGAADGGPLVLLGALGLVCAPLMAMVRMLRPGAARTS